MARNMRRLKTVERWLLFNIRGEGIRKSTRADKHSYIGPIYYAHQWPIARLVMLPDGHYACLNKHYVHPANPTGWTVDGGPRLTLNLSVPDIGVFSGYDGDWLSDTQLHERLRDFWMKVERAREMHFPQLVSGDSSGGGMQRTLRGAVDNATKEYRAYSAAFQLGWHSFPTIFRSELDQVIEDRSRVYFSDAEVKKRERATARAGAKRALGLDNEE